MPLLFTYGTLKRGFRNNHRIKTGRFLSLGKTKDKFLMMDMGAYPGLVHSKDEDGEHQINGEVFEIDAATFLDCDYLEGYPNLYMRYEIPIETPDGKELTCWCYFINRYQHGIPIGDTWTKK